MKAGDKIKYQHTWLHFRYLGDKNPKPFTRVEEVIIVAPAGGTDYTESDWIVCRPKDYPVKDLRSCSKAKHWGISENQIIS